MKRSIEISILFKPLLKYWWLIAAASLVAAFSSYFLTRNQPLIYTARTTLVIGRAVYETNPNSGDFYLNQQLAGYYADIAQRERVRLATMQALGIEWLPEYVVRPLPNSQLIEILVTDTSPVRAQAVANEIANQLIKQSPASLQAQSEERQSFINQQLASLEADIKKTQEEIDLKQAQLADLNSARQIAEMQGEISALHTKLATLQTNYSTLLANTGRGASNSLTVLEPAVLPTVPVGPNKKMIILLSTLIAFVIATGAAYLLEYLDDTLKDADEITRLYGLPVVGYLSLMGKTPDTGTYVLKKPRSVVADAFRYIKLNLDFVGVDKASKSILITSTNEVEGKTTLATNLAITLAQGGKRTVLLDADLRKPNVHNAFDLPNRSGLSDVFRGSLSLKDVVVNWPDIPLHIIPGGPPPPNPADLLASKKMDKFLESLEQTADVIIIDGPPSMVVDAAILSDKVDGVLFVVRYGYTRKGRAGFALEQLKRAGANLVGVVLNQLPMHSNSYYSNYGYHRYYEAEMEIPETGGPKRWLQAIREALGFKPRP